MITFKADIITATKDGKKDANWHITNDLWKLDEIHQYVYGINEDWVRKHQNGSWCRINAETLDNIHRFYMNRAMDTSAEKERILYLRWVFNALRDVTKGRIPYIAIGDVKYD